MMALYHYPGLYNMVVTVWLGNSIKHVKIKSEAAESGQMLFFTDPSQKFDSVPDFINFYHTEKDIPQSAYFRCVELCVREFPYNNLLFTSILLY